MVSTIDLRWYHPAIPRDSPASPLKILPTIRSELMSRPVYQQEHSTSPTRPVELDLGLYREIFTHSKEAIAIISPEGYRPV